MLCLLVAQRTPGAKCIEKYPICNHAYLIPPNEVRYVTCSSLSLSFSSKVCDCKTRSRDAKEGILSSLIDCFEQYRTKQYLVLRNKFTGNALLVGCVIFIYNPPWLNPAGAPITMSLAQFSGCDSRGRNQSNFREK